MNLRNSGRILQSAPRTARAGKLGESGSDVRVCHEVVAGTRVKPLSACLVYRAKA